MSTWTLTVLGASSTIPPAGDSNACLHLTNGDRTVLIDAGGNLPQLMRDLDEDYRDVTDLIVTHSHPDHTYGFPFLSHAFYHTHQSINCWSGEDATEKLKTSLEAYELVEPDKYLDVDFNVVSTDETDTINLPTEDSLTITTFPTRHSRPGFGLSLKSDNQRLVYSGDTAPIEVLDELDQPIHYLLHDCQATEGYKRYFDGGHSSAEDIGQIAARLDVDVLVPFHHNLVEFPPDRHEIGSEIRREFSGNLIFPTRGMSFYL